ncbi:hypothetical protein DACRYDRAFT_22814, partial [Dacryopinax primogenitus]
MMDTALLAHKECRKRQAKEQACSSLEPLQDTPPTGAAPASASSSQTMTDDAAVSQTNGSAVGIQKQDATLLDCLNCKRPIAFNRYAPHLASCMGLNVGSRRGQPRNASKRVDSEGTRSASPQVFSEEREATPSGPKTTKRNRSPSEMSLRDTKRPKTESRRTTPQPKSNGIAALLPGHYANSVPKAPSKLRSSPVASQGISGSPVASLDNGY